ncbi:MAG: phosphoribosylglycinamide formyltransferase [Oceanococcaceae bacterium]
MKRRRLAVLVSGTGRNLGAILDAIAKGQIRAQVSQVISNRPGVGALDIAAEHGVPAQVIDHTLFADRPSFDAALAEAIDASGAEAVILAGFMRVLTGEFVQRYTGRMLNIHPSLLPLYRGLHTHRRALEDGQSWHGASIHFVTPELDGGPVIKQGRIPIHPEDTPDSLAARVYSEIEQQLYPEVVGWLASGRLVLDHGKPSLDGQPLAQPLVEDY